MLFKLKHKLSVIFVILVLNNLAYTKTQHENNSNIEQQNSSTNNTPDRIISNSAKDEAAKIVKDIESNVIDATKTEPKNFSFGNYKIHLGANKPYFKDLKEYKLFYKDSSIAADFAVDYYILKFWISLGLTFRVGYYTDSGHPVVRVDNSLQKDSNTKLYLTIIPIDFGLVVQTTPFFYKWVVIGGWAAVEKTYFQETRSLSMGQSTSNEENKYYVNSLWKDNKALGTFLSLKINFLDYKSTSSLSMINIENVYLTFYLNQISKSKSSEKGISLARKVYGINFSFETF